jgi:hypothetical protein
METNIRAPLLQSFFLSINDIELIVEEEALVNLVLQVACGAIGKLEVAAFMRTHVQLGGAENGS